MNTCHFFEKTGKQCLHCIYLMGFITTLFSCNRLPADNNQVIINRIEYIYSLKEVVDKETWNGFEKKELDVPLVYYTDTGCYVTNPTEKFIALYRPALVYRNDRVTIYATPLLDSIPFHMETGITLGDSTPSYYYKSPFMNCSSLEITGKIIPGVQATEQWAAMIIHEYFHGFQYKHQPFIKYFEKNIAQVSADSLANMYKHQQWFMESVTRENDFLLKAIDAATAQETRNYIDSFTQLRQLRHSNVKQQLQFYIKPVEEAYETMEGTARYVEYSLYAKFATLEPDKVLQQSDTAYHSYSLFKNYHIEKDPWLYLADKTPYYYATGFNMCRLLDKLKIDYKPVLFNQSGQTLRNLLPR